MPDADPRLASLLSALGAHIGLPNLALSDDNICRIVLDGSLVIDIEHQPGSDNVQAFSVVGPHPGDNVRLLHKLLAGNLFGQGTGGAVLGLDEQRGEVLLCQPFDLALTTSERFISTMEAYVGYAQAWTSRDCAPVAGAAPHAASSAGPPCPCRSGGRCPLRPVAWKLLSVDRQKASRAPPAPQVPEPLQPRILRHRDWVWGTRVDVPRLYDIASYIDETTDTPVEDFFLLGHDGYGTNSWFLHCYLQHGPLSVFIQTPWGGAYADAKRVIDAVQRRFVLLERLLVAMDQALMGGHSLPGRLIVQQSSVESPRWGWHASDQPVTWQEEFANAMTPALESLQSHTLHRP